MTERTAARLAWGLAAVSVVIYGGAVGVSVWGGTIDLVEGGIFGLTPTLVFAGIGLLVARRQPANPIGWLFLATGVLWGISEFGLVYGRVALIERPGSLPGGLPVAWLQTWIWGPSIGLTTTVLLLLFPNGRLPSRRWRPVLVGAVVSVAGITVNNAFAPGSMGDEFAAFDNPFGLHGTLGRIAGTWAMTFFPLLMLSILGSVASLIVRFRRSRGEERQQIRLFVYTAAVAGIVMLLGFLLYERLPGVFGPLVGLALVAVPASAGVAILKYRLYDIDLVINKTFVYGALAILVTLDYVALVVGVGALVGDRASPVLSAAATAVAALLFLPMRRRLQRLANRLVYGKRATPYEVLSEFAERMATTYSAEDVLPRLARILGEATGAARTEVWLRVGGSLHRAATWPSKGEPIALPMRGDDLPEVPDVHAALGVRHQGELLGALALTKAPGEPLTPAEQRLLSDLASQAGLVLRNARLIEELRASRQRLVAAQDEERRRIERNIHDGAQQQLVALAVKLRLAESLTERDPAKARELIAQVKSETQSALEDLRDLARGIYPPLLADQGLAAALEAQARKSPVAVTVQPDGVGRYPQELEAAVYFCVLEALQNVAKYADAAQATVRLSATESELSFEVTDDGRGFDPSTTSYGSGLQGMADRLAALGGDIEVTAQPGRGTIVTGRVPATEVVRAP
jgi:signal transduction histidine kinase